MNGGKSDPSHADDVLRQRNSGKFGKRLMVGEDTALMVDVIPWFPFLVVDGWFPSAWLRTSDWPEVWSFLLWSRAMKRKEKKRGQETQRAAEDPDLRERFPTLYDYLTSLTYDGEDGGVRTVSTLLVFAADDVFKACLRDRDEGVCLWVAGRTFGDLLRVLEDELANDTGVWRLDRAAGHQVAARKPKPKSS